MFAIALVPLWWLSRVTIRRRRQLVEESHWWIRVRIGDNVDNRCCVPLYRFQESRTILIRTLDAHAIATAGSRNLRVIHRFEIAGRGVPAEFRVFGMLLVSENSVVEDCE